MSIKIVHLVWGSAPELRSRSRLLIMLALADWADDEGENIFPSMQKIAIKALMTDRNVRKHVRELEAEGWLLPVKKSTGRRTNEYRINLDALTRKEFPRSADDQPGNQRSFESDAEPGKNEHQPGKNEHQPGRQSPPHMNRHIEPSIEPSESARESSPRASPVPPESDSRKKTRITVRSFPSFIDPEIARGYLDFRRAKKAPVTERVMKLLTNALEELRAAGIDPNAALDHAMARNWQGFKPEWIRRDFGQQKPRADLFSRPGGGAPFAGMPSPERMEYLRRGVDFPKTGGELRYFRKFNPETDLYAMQVERHEREKAMVARGELDTVLCPHPDDERWYFEEAQAAAGAA